MSQNFWWNQRKSMGSRSSRGSQMSQYSVGGSRSSVGSRSSRGGSVRGSQPREIEFQFFIRQTETLYPPWWTREGIIDWFRELPDDTMWNCYICGCVLVGLVWTIAQINNIYVDILDVVYNISYAVHVFAIGYKVVTEMENTDITFWVVVGFLVDFGSFAHYVQTHNPSFKLGAYYARLQRPFKYLWSLSDYNLKGSVLGTTLKYCYIFMVLRITWAFVWYHVAVLPSEFYHELFVNVTTHETTVARRFLDAFYIINRMFIPIGPPIFPKNDYERVCCMCIMISGCLVVTGSAVASLSLIISLYMRPEETFRSRYRLIMKEMKDTKVPVTLRDKVETFYKMYWHKQRAVSATQLLPTFPPTMPTTIYIDIYFEATQKARILRELSYQLLSELAKKMETVHYIPGDAIIKRGSKKCNIIYITYGDIEMLTAEDDTTAILRMTRGTVLTPCGGAAAAAVGLSHLAVRAATFCTAHVLRAAELWRVVHRHSVTQDHAGPILASFTDHIERVKRHYSTKTQDMAIYKSSILEFNRHLLALKTMTDDKGVPVLASPDIFLEIAGCYIMRNRVDSTLTDQSDEICLRPTFPCILQPSSTLLMAWNSIIAILIFVVCITHPYHLVYIKEVPMEFRFFDFFMTLMFVLDLIVYLSTGANVEEGTPINFTQTSSQQMRSHWFVLDVVATLPIFEFVGNGHFGGINKLLRLHKLFRELKNLEERCVFRSNVLRFLTYTLLLLIACYLIAALQQGFMCYHTGYCVVTNFTHPPFWEKKPLNDDIGSRMSFGLYWAISILNFTFDRGGFDKNDWKHMVYALILLEMCIVMRIFMEAVYSATIMVTTDLREDYGSRIQMVKNFMIRNEMHPTLRKRFIDYLQLCWHTNKAYNMGDKKRTSIFYDLPPHVYQDIVGRNLIKYIMVIPFMKLLSKEDQKVVSSTAKLFYTSPNEILLNTGELTNEIYVIKQGICEILDPVSHKSVGHLTTKMHFGDLICVLRLPAYYTIRAITHVQVLSIPRRALTKLLASPQMVETLNFLRTQSEYAKLLKKIPAFIKYEPPPVPTNMMHFRLPRKHEPDSEFLNPFDRLGFLSILRYIFPRYTIRPDGKYLMRYEWFRFTCAVCSAQLFPHYTYLSLQWPFLYYVTLFLDLSAVYDIFQRMLIGYFNNDGILVYHPASTAAYYMKGAFIADLIGCLPLENLESTRLESHENKFRVTPTRQFLMLNRLIQLYRMPSAMMVLKNIIERRDILMVMRAVPLFMAVLNILTCFVIFESVKIFYSENDDGGYTWVIEPFDDPGGSWLLLFRDVFRFNLTATPWNLHLGTYFWMVYECSSTGYGVFHPTSQAIMKILFIGMVTSTMMATYFSVRIVSIRANASNSLAGFQHHMKDLTVYMAREKFDPVLQKELRGYYEYNWEKMGGIDYRGVLKLCDQITLRTDAILHIYGPTFQKCPLLVNADVSLLRIIGRAVRSVYFLRDMKILEYNDVMTYMYFVDYGGVEIRVTVGEMNSILRLPRGSVFGNLDGTAGIRAPYNVVATGRLHVLMIKSLAFATVTKDFPAIKELMAKSRAGDKKSKETKMYILGGEAQAKMRRNVPTGPPPRNKKSLVKYIYFQDGAVQIYLLVVSMICIYLDLYNAGYEDNSLWLIGTLYTLDFCFLLKIITQHSFPLLVTQKSLKTLMMPIRRLYFRREFKYDIISVIPLELLSYAFGKESMWSWFCWLRLNRMLRIMTVSKVLHRRNESITVNLTVTTVLAVFIWFSLFVHTTTCVWYFIAAHEDQFSPNSSWIHRGDGTTHCNNLYICSFYFVITTFTQNSVGDIIPKNHNAVLFVSVLQIIATMVFMVYVGAFSNIIQYQSYRSFSFYSKYLELQEFMKNNRVSKNLVTIVNRYTLHLWRENRGLQLPLFLRRAPLSLRLRAMSAAYLHHITRHHIFEECEPAFLRQLVGCLKVYTYNEDMYVVKESEITNSMYVIHTGKVKETSEELEIAARVYPAGSYYGVGLVRNTPYTHSYQTMTKSQVLTLNLDDWEYLLKHFPDSRDAIHRHMTQLGDKDADQSNWPGGPPVAPQVTHTLEPISEMEAATDLSQFPNIQRPFGRISMSEGDDEPFIPSGRRESRYFGWPTQNRDETPSRRVTETEEQNIEELKPKLGFMGTLLNTAKKLMGRVSETEETLELEGDNILLEEDAETTEALLKQFEKAKKDTESTKFSRMKERRKSMFQTEESTEKHLLTLDMEKSLIDAKESSVMLRSIQMDDEDEAEETTAENAAPAVLNLSRAKSRIVQRKSEDKDDASNIAQPSTSPLEKLSPVTQDTQSLKPMRSRITRDSDEVGNKPFYIPEGQKDAQDTQPALETTEGQQTPKPNTQDTPGAPETTQADKTLKPMRSRIARDSDDAGNKPFYVPEAQKDAQDDKSAPETKQEDQTPKPLIPVPEVQPDTQDTRAAPGPTDDDQTPKPSIPTPEAQPGTKDTQAAPKTTNDDQTPKPFTSLPKDTQPGPSTIPQARIDSQAEPELLTIKFAESDTSMMGSPSRIAPPVAPPSEKPKVETLLRSKSAISRDHLQHLQQEEGYNKSIENLSVSEPPAVTPTSVILAESSKAESYASNDPEMEKESFASSAARTRSFVKRSIVFDPNAPGAFKEREEHSYVADEDDSGAPVKVDDEKDLAMSKSESTNTRISRRFVHVRYEPEDGEASDEDVVDLSRLALNERDDDSDRPKRTGVSDEGDDEATTSSTTVSAKAKYTRTDEED